jgi:thiamine-monophosphate kinase
MHETTWIRRYISPLVDAPGADGLRDDVATLHTSGTIIATMDTIVEGVHFLPEDPLRTVAQKAIRVNVSDIYAKGARPLEALLSIAWPRDWNEQRFAAFIEGLGEDLKRYDVSLIGGDMVGTTGPLTVTITMTGKCLAERPIRRAGGCAGEALYLCGEIGRGYLGLQAAQRGEENDVAHRYRVPDISPLSSAHTVSIYASASMDVSDGLLIDTNRMAQASECGVELFLDRIPLAQPSDGLETILAQCTGGDDYRILISAPKGLALKNFSEIGILTDRPGLNLTYKGARVNVPSTLGFEH